MLTPYDYVLVCGNPARTAHHKKVDHPTEVASFRPLPKVWHRIEVVLLYR